MNDFFGGGIRLKQYKSDILSHDTAAFSKKLPLQIPIKRNAVLTAAMGDFVERDAILAKDPADGRCFYNPEAGFIRGIYDFDHPVLGPVKIVLIFPQETESISDGFDKRKKQEKFKPNEDIASVISGITDLSDGTLLKTKLDKFMQAGIKTIAVNAMEDQPYACADAALLLTRYEDVLSGLKIAAKYAGAKKYEILVYRSRSIDMSGLAKRDGVKIIGGKYPISQKYVDNNTTGYIGAQTCYDIYAHRQSGKKQTEILVTVAGSRLTEPKNLWVKIGTPIGELLDYCEPVNDIGAIVVGDGPMTGRYIEDLNVPVYQGLKSVLLLKPLEISDTANCWGCARCAEVCPKRLMPLYIARVSRHGIFDEAKKMGADRCIGCGCCTYVCSGGINPKELVLKAKSVVENSGSEKTGIGAPGASIPEMNQIREKKETVQIPDFIRGPDIIEVSQPEKEDIFQEGYISEDKFEK